MKKASFTVLAALLLSVSFAVIPVFSQASRPPEDLFNEVSAYVQTQIRELNVKGKKMSREYADQFERERTSLAKKYSEVAAAMSSPKPRDLLYTAFLYEEAKNEKQALEFFRRTVSATAPDAAGNGLQIARSRIVVYAGREKLFDEMEKAYAAWAGGSPTDPALQASLVRSMATSYFNAKNYDQAIKYGQSAFELVRKLEAKTWRERSQKTDIYADLVETMLVSYKGAGRKDEALGVLAEARATAFTIPSAALYTKVMDMVSKYGISEKKLMQKVESYPNADSAPDFAVEEWMGQEPATLESLRGKVVLLDFWATWCGPCISTFPRLRSWHKKFAPQGLTILGIVKFEGQIRGQRVDRPTEREFLKAFKEEYKLPYGFAITEGQDTSAKYGIPGIPATFLLDKKGVVRYIGVGASPEEAENLEEMIKKVLAEQ